HFSPRMKIRFGWANDHLVLSKSAIDGDYDVKAHNKLVADIRRAATRAIDTSYIALPMQRIVAHSSMTETDELGSVLATDENDERDESGHAA
ncbi:MAG: hypothetical protein QOJ29_4616, partial [Thermoleophilaceae bacterium]|nr:hypothetical protein [Thermoleophilaceae bacterium]